MRQVGTPKNGRPIAWQAPKLFSVQTQIVQEFVEAVKGRVKIILGQGRMQNVKSFGLWWHMPVAMVTGVITKLGKYSSRLRGLEMTYDLGGYRPQRVNLLQY